jgi:hypothetical protein
MEDKEEHMSSAYDQLEQAVSDHLKDYRDDLELHDRIDIDRLPNTPFIHVTRESGTHLFQMKDAQHLPVGDQNTKYLFAHIPVARALESRLEGIQVLGTGNYGPIKIHYFDGQKLHEVSVEQATQRYRAYINEVTPHLENTPGRESRLNGLETEIAKQRGFTSLSPEAIEIENGTDARDIPEQLRVRRADTPRGKSSAVILCDQQNHQFATEIRPKAVASLSEAIGDKPLTIITDLPINPEILKGTKISVERVSQREMESAREAAKDVGLVLSR